MLCKTGGGTLIDSLWSATPIVALEPFGEHEQINALLWERLGFGMGYDAWRSSGFSLDLLEKAHLNLLRARDGVADYTADLAGSARAEAISDAG
jgi:UDP-N-acetylglucosamine:LPS N-acetylglucosamine transferase